MIHVPLPEEDQRVIESRRRIEAFPSELELAGMPQGDLVALAAGTADAARLLDAYISDFGRMLPNAVTAMSAVTRHQIDQGQMLATAADALLVQAAFSLDRDQAQLVTTALEEAAIRRIERAEDQEQAGRYRALARQIQTDLEASRGP